jgi:hypothetical protein
MLEEIEKLDSSMVLQMVELRRRAKDASETFATAVKNGAKIARVKPAAMRKFIVALDDDKVGAVQTEQMQIDMLFANALPQLAAPA